MTALQVIAAGLAPIFGGYAVARRRFRRRALTAAAAALAAIVVAAMPTAAWPAPDEVVEDLVRSLGAWTYVVVGALAFLETAALVGLVMPGELTVVVAGTVAAQGEIGLVPLIGVAWVSATLGDSVGFWLGRRLGRAALHRHAPRLGISPALIASVEGYFRRRGGQAVLVGRWIGVVRSVAPFLAGASGLPYRRFLPWSVAGAGAWSAVFATLGYVFWESFDVVLDRAGQASGAVAVLAALVVLVRWRRAHRRRDRPTHAVRRRPPVDRLPLAGGVPS
jgi:membrane protein DedA with SNARE-associated domain